MLLKLLHTLQDSLQPLPLVWIMLTFGVIRQSWLRHWRAAAGWLLPWLLLTMATCTLLPSSMVHSMEKGWAGTVLTSLPDCDTVVCLGGAAQPSLHEPTGFHVNRCADRITSALSVASSGKVKEWVVGGGGYEHEGLWLSEADQIEEWLEGSKLSPVPVTSLGICADTHDEAMKVAALCRERGWTRVLLVTSAIHMSRAKATFEKAGVTVTCLPCNFHSAHLHVGDLSVFHLPHAGGLDLFGMWWHEFAGWHVYRWRGWL